MREKTILEQIKTYCRETNDKFIFSYCYRCSYAVGYIWNHGKLFYDSGCGCLSDRIVQHQKDHEAEKLIKSHLAMFIQVLKEHKIYSH